MPARNVLVSPLLALLLCPRAAAAQWRDIPDELGNLAEDIAYLWAAPSRLDEDDIPGVIGVLQAVVVSGALGRAAHRAGVERVVLTRGAPRTKGTWSKRARPTVGWPMPHRSEWPEAALAGDSRRHRVCRMGGRVSVGAGPALRRGMWRRILADGCEWEVRVVAAEANSRAGGAPVEEILEFCAVNAVRSPRRVTVAGGSLQRMDDAALLAAYRRARTIGGDHYGRPGKRMSDVRG